MFKITNKSPEIAAYKLISKVNISERAKNFTFLHETNQAMLKGIYHSLKERKRQNKKSFAVLVDPDKVNDDYMEQLIPLVVEAKVDYLLVGGSLVISNYLDQCVQLIKKNCSIPV
ncbi:MAG: hypothetical protein ABIN36_14705, partial [Ferruginibacter sp.]